jgi:glucose/arabinose dehydrogenase
MTSHRRGALYRVLGAGLLLLLLVAAVPIVLAADPAPILPPGFSDELIVGTQLNNRVPAPTALAFLPDGRLLITSSQGTLHIWEEGASPAVKRLLDLRGSVCNNGERGFVGLALDPSFATNGFLYIYYTRKTSATCPTSANDVAGLPVNRLSRFTMANDSVDLASELVLLDGIVNHGGNHNGGALRFGADGFLYLAIGDDSRPRTADDDDNLRGKILRLDPASGDGAPGNPHGADPAAIRCGDPVGPRIGQGLRCREIFAKGLRNPFRITFKPGSDEFYINDVGQQTWEEISLGQIGADYGWDSFEGPCPKQGHELCGPQYPASTPGRTAPFFWYGHRTIDPRAQLFGGCAAITGGAFVPPGIWPASFDGVYMFADYVCGRIWTLAPDGAGQHQATIFVDGLNVNSAVDMLFGPTAGGGQALYYTVLNGGGQIHRIRYTSGANRSPSALASAEPVAGSVPLTVTFDGGGSSDPDGDSLTYSWDFGDGSPVVERATATISHTYTLAGVYEATLRVRDSRGASSSAPARIRIDAGNSAPELAITIPTSETGFRVGEEITLQGSATDPEDGALPGGALVWEVLLHHNEHTHPYLAPTAGDTVTITAPPPEDLDAAAESYLEILLTATDSKGLARTVSQAMQPHRVAVTFETQPPGLQLVVNGSPITGPHTATSWEGYALTVQAADQSGAAGGAYTFQGWSDGAAAERTIITPGEAARYTAIFERTAAGPATVIFFPMVRPEP